MTIEQWNSLEKILDLLMFDSNGHYHIDESAAARIGDLQNDIRRSIEKEKAPEKEASVNE